MKLRIERIDLGKADVVQRIFETSPDYFLRTDKTEVLSHFAAREISDAVPLSRRTTSYSKVFCLILNDDEPIGVVDLHKDHPLPGICYLGLLLISGPLQSKGLGRLAYNCIERFIVEELGCTSVRLGISEDNDVAGFWEKLGFERNGHSYLWPGENNQNPIFEMQKTFKPKDAKP